VSLTVSVREIVSESHNPMLHVDPSWERIELRNIANVANGFAFKSRNFNRSKGTPLIRIRNVGNNCTECFYDGDYDRRYLVRSGDLIVGMDGDFKLARWRGAPGLLNQRVCKIDITTNFYDSRFLELVLPGYLSAINEATSSQTVKHLSSRSIEEIPLPLPPLAEQKRVVAKIETLLSRVNAARERLAKVPIILRRFRQAVLAAACSGRLTEEWHKEHSGVSRADEIVESIRRRKMHEVGAKKVERVLEIYKYQEENNSEKLPPTWRYMTLDKLVRSFDYGTSAKSKPTGKVPVLRMGNIQNGRIDWSDLMYTSDSGEIKKYRLKPGTVLFNRTNSPELVGKTAIYRGEQPAIFAGYLIRVNNEPELNPEYLNCCLNTDYAREYCMTVKTDGVSQSNINAQKLAKFEIPFCSPEEQQEIVYRVEALFKLADAIEKRVAAATMRTDKLTQAVLAKAFRGELVSTEADLARREGRNYETAAQLLARIKAVREIAGHEQATSKLKHSERRKKGRTSKKYE